MWVLLRLARIKLVLMVSSINTSLTAPAWYVCQLFISKMLDEKMNVTFGAYVFKK